MSEALTAALPSLPMIPNPMWASWIMATSLPPSPMAAVTGLPGEVLISLIISLFWRGDSLQQTTAEQDVLIYGLNNFESLHHSDSKLTLVKSKELFELESIDDSVSPSTISPHFSCRCFTWSLYWWSLGVSWLDESSSLVRSRSVMSGFRWPEEKEILIAVSFLSPLQYYSE